MNQTDFIILEPSKLLDGNTKPFVTVRGNITKKGVLVFTTKIMTETGLSETDHIEVAQRKNETDKVYLFIHSAPTAKSLPLSKVTKAYGLSIPGLLRELIPDYKEQQYRYLLILKPVKGFDGIVMELSFEKGHVKL